MKFLFCVFVLLIGLNRSELTKAPHDQVNNANFNQQTLTGLSFASTDSNNSEIEERVKILRTPHKLENDKNLYRVIRLSNGLTALLISTQENELNDRRGINNTVEYLKFHPKKAACNLNVDVGSFSNPRDAQGLGHLVGNFDFFSLHIVVSTFSLKVFYISI